MHAINHLFLYTNNFSTILSPMYVFIGKKCLKIGGIGRIWQKNLGDTISEGYKSGEAPMVKIKTFH